MWFLKKKKLYDLDIDEWRFSFKRMEAWIPDSVDVQGVIRITREGEKISKPVVEGNRLLGIMPFFSDDYKQEELDKAYEKFVDEEFDNIVLIGK